MEHSGAFRRKVSFSQVSNTIIRDNTISLKAKGLYSLIQSYITMDNFILYKDFLLQQCMEGESCFRGAWKELKDKGYLIQYKLRDPVSKTFYYEYELLDEPHVDFPHVGNLPYGEATCGKQGVYNNTISNNTLNSNTIEDNTQDWWRDKVHIMIDYDKFEDKTIVDQIVEVIIDTILSKQKTYSICSQKVSGKVVRQHMKKLTYLAVKGVIEDYTKCERHIKSPKSYLRAMLYSSVDL